MTQKIANSFREKALSGGVASTLSVRLIKTNEIVMMAKTAGFDGLMIDLEHSMFDLETTSQICIAALGVGITPIVRVPSQEASTIERILDGGALGVIIPHIKTAQQVQNVVRTAKFQPVGNRSESGAMPHFQYRPLPAEVVQPLCNEATMVIPMIETLEALEAVGDIAAVPGVDALFIGGNDLTGEMGIPGDYANPRFIDACAKIISACNENRIICGLGGFQSRMDLVDQFCEMGARWVLAATDSALLFNAACQKAKEMKKFSDRVEAKLN